MISPDQKVSLRYQPPRLGEQQQALPLGSTHFEAESPTGNGVIETTQPFKTKRELPSLAETQVGASLWERISLGFQKLFSGIKNHKEI